MHNFLKFALLVFHDIAQDCSLGQCLTPSRAETSKKKNVVQIRAKMRFSSIFLVISYCWDNFKTFYAVDMSDLWLYPRFTKNFVSIYFFFCFCLLFEWIHHIVTNCFYSTLCLQYFRRVDVLCKYPWVSLAFWGALVSKVPTLFHVTVVSKKAILFLKCSYVNFMVLLTLLIYW